jgi:hypothetical protein
MGETTLERRHRTAHRSRTALCLALPAAAVVHLLGTLASSLLIGMLVGSWSSPGLEAVLTTANVLLALVVVALCLAALLAERAAARPGVARHRSRVLAIRALAVSLLVPGLYALLWYSGLGVDLVMSLGTAVSVIGLVLAALALVGGILTATRGPARPGRTAAAVAAVATPAALLTPVIGMVVRSPGAYTVAAYAGVVLAVVGLAAAVVALRRDAAGVAAGDDTGQATGREGAVAAGTESPGRRFLRHLATPLALAALLLAAPALATGDDGVLAVVLLVAAFALAVAGITGAVLRVRAERREGRVRVAAGLAAFTLPLAVTLVPAAVGLAAVFGDEDGWAVLGALFISVPLAAVVALTGLVAAIVAASARHYPGRAAAASVLCTALVPVALVLFVPLQAAGLALASAVLAGLLLTAALVTGLVAVVSGGAQRPGAPETARNPYL